LKHDADTVAVLGDTVLGCRKTTDKLARSVEGDTCIHGSKVEADVGKEGRTMATCVVEGQYVDREVKCGVRLVERRSRAKRCFD